MGPRAIYAILGLGLVALVSMGLMTKYIFDSNPGLRKTTRFKAQLLEKFGDRGVREISYRRTRNPRGVELRLVVAPETLRADETLDLDIARFYLETYPRAHAHLKLSYSTPSRWGCSASDRAERVLDIVEVRRALRERDRVLALERAVAGFGGIEVRDVERSGDEITISAFWTAGSETGGAEEMLASLARVTVETYRPQRATRIRVRLLGKEAVPDEEVARGAEGAPAKNGSRATAEGVFDFRGRRLPGGR